MNIKRLNRTGLNGIHLDGGSQAQCPCGWTGAGWHSHNAAQAEADNHATHCPLADQETLW